MAIPGESVDLVAAGLVLEHVDDLGPVFKEAERALRQGGAMFVCEFHPFQQLAGLKAQYVDPATQAIMRVPAFQHDVSDFVTAGLNARLRLDALDEWRYSDDAPGAPPKLLSLMFVK